MIGHHLSFAYVAPQSKTENNFRAFPPPSAASFGPIMLFRTFLFDLDGTLLDHFEAIHRCHTQTMTHFGLPPPSLIDVRNAIGGGIEQAIAKLFGPQHAALVVEATAYYRSCFPQHLLVGLKLMPGALELIRALNAQGATCAVFTNKHGPSAREVCDHLGVTPLVRGIFGAMDTPWLKPQPEFADHVLRALGAKAEGTMLVGDSPWDVDAAHNAGFPCWVVTTGTHTAEELRVHGADRIFPGLPEVHRALLGHSTGTMPLKSN
jgi:phosphoglycolate phosphatase